MEHQLNRSGNLSLLGLIGKALSHSFSQKYFTEKFRKENLQHFQYELFSLNEISEIKSLIENKKELKGFNVTIPYKESILPFLDELDDTAMNVGAVNTVKIIENKEKGTRKLIGYNTDVFGFRESIKPYLESHHNRALILGTGGAAKAVAYVLKQIGVEYHFVSRSILSGNSIRYQDLNENIIMASKLIINTSPVGMFPAIENSPLIPYEHLNSQHFLYDLIYNPTETQFLRKGKERGCMVMNGLSMLYFQAEKSWEIWNS